MGLVSFLNCCPPHYILDHAQHHRMDKEQAVPPATGQLDIHQHHNTRPTILGTRDLRELCLL